VVVCKPCIFCDASRPVSYPFVTFRNLNLMLRKSKSVRSQLKQAKFEFPFELREVVLKLKKKIRDLQVVLICAKDFVIL
jgi:hypothetical protein